MKHSFRTQETPNAVPERLHLNTQETPGVDSVGQGMAAFRARLPEKHRKDAVQCIEYLISASAESYQRKIERRAGCLLSGCVSGFRIVTEPRM